MLSENIHLCITYATVHNLLFSSRLTLNETSSSRFLGDKSSTLSVRKAMSEAYVH